MTTLKRIYYLLQPEERRKVWKMAGTVFFSALLDFVSLAALLPVLYILLKGGENRRAALLFCLLAIGIIVVKSVYNPQIQISAESETKRSIFREKDKTKRSKKESAQHSKSRNKSFVMTSVSAL